MITHHDLVRWKNNSLELAHKLGLDYKILDSIDKNVKLTLEKGLPPEEMWYGWCIFHKNEVIVYSKNLSTEDINTVMVALRAKGMPEKFIQEIIEVYNKVTPPDFFEIYNQSGMDHELVGHLYNYLAGEDHFEKAAVETQINFARERIGLVFGKNWARVLEIMPKVLGYHKEIDELK